MSSRDDEYLQDVIRELKGERPRRRPTQSSTWWVIGLVLLIGVATAATLRSATLPAPATYEDHSEAWRVVAPFKTLEERDEAWVGVLDPTWQGYRDERAGFEDCVKVAAALGLPPERPLILQRPDGTPTVVCHAGGVHREAAL